MVLRGFLFMASLALNALGVLAYLEMDKYVDLEQLTEEMIASRKRRRHAVWDELPASWKEEKDKLFRCRILFRWLADLPIDRMEVHYRELSAQGPAHGSCTTERWEWEWKLEGLLRMLLLRKALHAACSF
jgi:hypothetical protein